MAAAVSGRDDAPRWALSVTGVPSHVREDRRAFLGQALLTEAHRLSRSLRTI